jgi:hypothetical protein
MKIHSKKLFSALKKSAALWWGNALAHLWKMHWTIESNFSDRFAVNSMVGIVILSVWHFRLKGFWIIWMLTWGEAWINFQENAILSSQKNLMSRIWTAIRLLFIRLILSPVQIVPLEHNEETIPGCCCSSPNVGHPLWPAWAMLNPSTFCSFCSLS